MGVPHTCPEDDTPSADAASGDEVCCPCGDDDTAGEGEALPLRGKHTQDYSGSGGGPSRNGTWLAVSWVMLSDLVGTSVLTLAGVARDLGWAPLLCGIFGLAPIAVYTACLMSSTLHWLSLRRSGRAPGSMAECAGMLCADPARARCVERTVYVVVYGFALLGQGSYLQTLAKTLQGALYDVHLCLPVAASIAAACLVPFVVSIRTLRDSVPICFANLFLILIVLALCVQKLVTDGRGREVETHTVNPHLTFTNQFGSWTNLVYSFSGHWMYFEIMSEMDRPADFPKVFMINAPLQVVLYAGVAAVGYYYGGDLAKSNFIDNIPTGAVYRAANVLLFAHVLVAYVIKSVVVSKYLHSLLAPGAGTDASSKAHLQWAALGCGQLVFCYLVANLIPFFSDLLGLIGGLLSAPIGYILPCVLYVLALRLNERHPNDTQKLLIGISVVIGICTMVMGTIQEVKDIVKKNGEYGYPFDCHRWNVNAT
eukprot:TRINITY_DN55629_c0_g1_i1.p1 TRINITY_DN55629_c0_g1~~TRINITY_DN55629_c0_g1_i1.p1  ORF type:complete len:517 (+),score=122.48 TRINITY_DN55629_c0_g1_i1:107-1552(+)